MNKLSYLSPFDILVKNFFDNEGEWLPAVKAKTHYPVDIYEDKEGLHLEVACTGLTKKDVDVKIDGRFITIKHEANNDIKTLPVEEKREYFTRGISKKSFNLGYKIDVRFDIDKAKAKMENGLLEISVPHAEPYHAKKLVIN